MTEKQCWVGNGRLRGVPSGPVWFLLPVLGGRAAGATEGSVRTVHCRRLSSRMGSKLRCPLGCPAERVTAVCVLGVSHVFGKWQVSNANRWGLGEGGGRRAYP